MPILRVRNFSESIYYIDTTQIILNASNYLLLVLIDNASNTIEQSYENLILIALSSNEGSSAPVQMHIHFICRCRLGPLAPLNTSAWEFKEDFCAYAISTNIS